MKMINRAEIDGNGNVVIQSADNSLITINKDNPEEIRNFFFDFQNQLSELPKTIIDYMEAQNPNQVVTTGANIYLGLMLLFETMNGINTGKIEGISFGVTITNLTKENRFFNAPAFKLSTPFEGDLDTFVITDIVGASVQFPKKLEYGEEVSLNYRIHKNSKKFIFDKVIVKDSSATIQVIVSTTFGEIYKSNEYPITKLLENYKYA